MLFLREHQPKQNRLAFLHITLQDITKSGGALSTCPSHDDKNDSRKLRLTRVQGYGSSRWDGVPEESSVTEWLTDRPTSCGDQPKMCSCSKSGDPPMDWSRSALNNIILAIFDWSHLSNRLICLFTAPEETSTYYGAFVKARFVLNTIALKDKKRAIDIFL